MELGTEFGLQLCERDDVTLDTSTVSVGPVVERSGFPVIRCVDDVDVEARHSWCYLEGRGKCLLVACERSWWTV